MILFFFSILVVVHKIIGYPTVLVLLATLSLHPQLKSTWKSSNKFLGGLSCCIMSLWAASSYFLLVWIRLLLLVKQSHITCTIGSVHLLITHLCLHSELNDLKNCGLKWKGERGEGRHIRKKRGSGMHPELKNLNFPDHLKRESHWKCRTRCSSGVNRHGSLGIRELCKYLSAKDAGCNFFKGVEKPKEM